MVDVNKLKGKIRERQYTIKSLAAAVNLNPATLYRHFGAGGESLTIDEVTRIGHALKLTYDDINQIFFANYVA